ncbi:MAG: hypothetical protein JO363_06950 [Solirubrobacterales bacterium]|nr:hypothetical protein [Solirubrobacterales bacterium]
MRELRKYLAHTCFAEIAVPLATADLVDVAARAAPAFHSGGRSPAEAAARRDAFWEMHDALFADQGRLQGPHLWTALSAWAWRSSVSRPADARTRSVTASETTSGG